MSEPLSDLEEAHLHLSSVAGRMSGIETAVKFLREHAATKFIARADDQAKLLRQLAGSLHQDVEVLNVERVKTLKTIQTLEAMH